VDLIGLTWMGVRAEYQKHIPPFSIPSQRLSFPRRAGMLRMRLAGAVARAGL
jgi:hypothetical protein